MRPSPPAFKVLPRHSCQTRPSCNIAAMTERRSASRIALGFDVDLTHPSFGTRRVRAENLSDGGLWVALGQASLAVGARVTVRAVPDAPLASGSTPAVLMEVRHRSEQGVGLAFASRTAEHLWEAARRALAPIGDADFALRVYHAAAVTHDGAILLVRGASRWAFPGTFLDRPTPYHEHLAHLVADQIGIEIDPARTRPRDVTVAPGSPPLYVVYFECPAATAATVVSLSDTWREYRWVGGVRELEHLEVADPSVRLVATRLLPEAAGRLQR